MFRRTFIASASTLAFSRVQAAGTPWVCPEGIMQTFEQFDTLPVYTSTSTGALGTVYLLKSDAKASSFSWDPTTIQDKLQLILFMSGKTLGKRLISGTNYQRLDETGAGARNQCVAFAKAMTNAGTTTGWKKGTTMLSLFPNGRAPSQLPEHPAVARGAGRGAGAGRAPAHRLHGGSAGAHRGAGTAVPPGEAGAFAARGAR